jgi:rieske iron-sulfur protein
MRVAVPRRRLLGRGVLAAGIMTLPAARRSNDVAGPQIGDVFVSVTEPQGAPIRSDALSEASTPILAWPRNSETGVTRSDSRLNQVLILWLRGANEAKGDILAFSAICPHAGCLVSQWIRASRHLRCPCHGSEFNPTRAGIVTAGPSPLPLPSLPVETVKDLVTVAGPFSAPPGGHTSRTM